MYLTGIHTKKTVNVKKFIISEHARLHDNLRKEILPPLQVIGGLGILSQLAAQVHDTSTMKVIAEDIAKIREGMTSGAAVL